MPIKTKYNNTIKSIKCLTNDNKEITYTNKNVYTGQVLTSDIRHGKGKIIFYDFTFYNGEWNNDLIEGYGEMSYKSGDLYKGEFKKNNRHGIGRYDYTNGDFDEGMWEYNELLKGNIVKSGKSIKGINCVFTGEINNKLKNGKATIKYDSGDIFLGNYLNDKRDGYCIYRWSDKSFYKGEWKNDTYHGKGEDKFSNGNTFQGLYENGKKNGYGIMNYINGDIYQGEWKDDDKSGTGELIYYIYQDKTNPYIYKGNFLKNIKNGYGEIKCNTYIYNGEWKNNLKHGKGKIDKINEYIYDGEWQDDKINGNGIINYHNGDSYKGYFKDDFRNGIGLYKSKNYSYNGYYLKNKKNGKGIYIRGNQVYDGEWKDDKRHGEGIINFTSETNQYCKYQGQWENNNMTGYGHSIDSNGDYTGNFINGKFNGNGIIIVNNSEKINGVWDNNYLILDDLKLNITEIFVIINKIVDLYKLNNFEAIKYMITNNEKYKKLHINNNGLFNKYIIENKILNLPHDNYKALEILEKLNINFNDTFNQIKNNININGYNISRLKLKNIKSVYTKFLDENIFINYNYHNQNNSNNKCNYFRYNEVWNNLQY